MYSKGLWIFLLIQFSDVSGQTTVPSPSGATVVDLCQQPMVVGPCRASKPRFWYDAEKAQCEHFLYGGCHGNENNFEREEECVAACVDKPKIASPAAVNPVTIVASTMVVQQRTGDYMCHQPKEVGPCRGAFHRYWFNDQIGQCEKFLYGGCEGNENRFEKESECVRVCKERGWKATTTTTPVPPTTASVQFQRNTDDICTQPMEVGSCRALLPRFWFNPATKRCESFSYGGCDGNENNFKRESQCIATCVERDQEGTDTYRLDREDDSPPIMMTQPAVSGPDSSDEHHQRHSKKKNEENETAAGGRSFASWMTTAVAVASAVVVRSGFGRY